MHRIAILVSLLMVATITWGQPQSQQPASTAPAQNMPGHDTSGMQMKDTSADKDDTKDPDASLHMMHSMEGHMDMGPHMKMTALRPAKPEDAARAQKVVDAARKVADQYLDYHVALADGFKIFHPEIPQKLYHFTNYSYGFENAFRFTPEHPTSLLYEKHGDDYKLIGVMYTAPKRLTEDELDARIPLSVTQWHEHVNFCRAPVGREGEYLKKNPQFGLRGSIATQEACDAAGGSFQPVIFNWMVHVYPFEKDQASIWSVERQHGDAD
jgi:hypothetical protein